MKMIILPPTRDDWTLLFAQLLERLEEINASQWPIMDKALKACEICNTQLFELRKTIVSFPFKDEHEEIYFFKFVKPRFHCYFIYWNKVFNVEIRRPAVNAHGQRKYFQQESRWLRLFFTKHASFYQYYRSGATFMDDYYFLRKRKALFPLLHPMEVDADPAFSTIYDYLVARILANDMLVDYLETAATSVSHTEASKLTSVDDKVTTDFAWQPTAVALAELVYALSAYGAVTKGSGRVPDQVLADVFGRIFNVNLEYYHKKKEEIRARQKNRTVFLSALIRHFNQKLDEDDENAL